MWKDRKVYISSVACILMVTAAAKLYSATGAAKVLSVAEGLLPMSNRQALLLIGVIELAVSLFLCFGRSDSAKLVCVAWLGLNFFGYRIASALLVVGKPCPCLGAITERIPLKPAVIIRIMVGIVFYLVIGSFYYLMALRNVKPADCGSETLVAPIVPEG